MKNSCLDELDGDHSSPSSPALTFFSPTTLQVTLDQHLLLVLEWVGLQAEQVRHCHEHIGVVCMLTGDRQTKPNSAVLWTIERSVGGCQMSSITSGGGSSSSLSLVNVCCSTYIEPRSLGCRLDLWFSE